MIMNNVTAKPQLSFGEAIKLASGRVTDFKGRSRRSEYWWFMLAFLIGYFIISWLLGKILPPIVTSIITPPLWFAVLAVTVRRLQDTGKSKWWVVVSWISMLAYSLYFNLSGISEQMMAVNTDPQSVMKALFNPVLMVLGLVYTVTSLVTIIFCLLDGSPESNKYGESPKYIINE